VTAINARRIVYEQNETNKTKREERREGRKEGVRVESDSRGESLLLRVFASVK